MTKISILKVSHFIMWILFKINTVENIIARHTSCWTLTTKYLFDPVIDTFIIEMIVARRSISNKICFITDHLTITKCAFNSTIFIKLTLNKNHLADFFNKIMYIHVPMYILCFFFGRAITYKRDASNLIIIEVNRAYPIRSYL